MPGMYVYKIYEDGNYAYAGDKDTEIYQLYLVDTGNEIQLSYNYRGSGPWEENILYTFSYTDGYNIDYYTSDDNENWNISKNEVDINYINNNVFDQPLSTNIKLDFHDIVDDPGDDPGDDTYYSLLLFSEQSVNFIGSYTNDQSISFYAMDNEIHINYGGNDSVVFYYTDGFTAEISNSGWELLDTYTNNTNFDLTNLDTDDTYIVFHNVVNPGPSVNKTHVGNSTVALKKVGNATVVKEVLNGVTIYQA